MTEHEFFCTCRPLTCGCWWCGCCCQFGESMTTLSNTFTAKYVPPYINDIYGLLNVSWVA
jgi:hypothetical protein